MGLGHQGRVGTTLESMVASQRGDQVSVLSQQKFLFGWGLYRKRWGVCLNARVGVVWLSISDFQNGMELASENCRATLRVGLT